MVLQVLLARVRSRDERGSRELRALSAAVCLAALGVAGVVLALDDVEFASERIDGAGWRAQALRANVVWRDHGASARVRIDELRLRELGRTLRNIRIDCPKVELGGEAYACKGAAVRFTDAALGAQSVTADVRYATRGNAIDVRMKGLRLGAGSANVSAALRDGAWSVSAELTGAPMGVLVKLAAEVGVASPLAVSDGRVTAAVRAQGAGGEIRNLQIKADMRDLTLNNESGSLATDKLAFVVEGTLQHSTKGWAFTVEARSSVGQAYAQPIFLDAGVRALSLEASGLYDGGSAITLERFTIDHAGVAKAHGRARVALEHEHPVRSLDLQLASLEFPGAYESYFQPFLLDTSFKSLQTSGSIAGRIRIEEGAPQSIDLALDRLGFDDGASAFALDNLNGRWVWASASGADAQAPPDAGEGQASHLAWNGGVLLGLELGAGAVDFTSYARNVRLLAPTTIPVFDGAVEIDSFRVRGVGTPKAAFLVDANIRPISVERLCEAFGWPKFGGHVSGAVSKLRMREGVVTLGAALDAQVFDGLVSVRDLRLEEPFGEWPRLHATIDLANLDLELVTGAFSFGRITGRLSGAIGNLELFNWTPVAFDARLYTPANDRSRRRISQRAVQNIGSIGGSGAGVAAALSSGFLSFFDDFNYDRLGISCRLENDVCLMGGVAPAPNGGYYLVKGRGVPRIHVIGNARRVDWPRLVEQLAAITKSEGPVVQ